MKKFTSRTKMHIWILFRNIGMLFRPITAILFSAVSMVILIIPLSFWVLNTHNTSMRDILLAIITGVTASFFVAIVIEIAENFRRNKRKDIELAEYYSKLYSFEISRLTLSGLNKYLPGLTQLIHSDKSTEDPPASTDDASHDKADSCEEDPDDDLNFHYDDIQILWKHLPELINLFEDLYQNKRDYLSLKEAESLNYILSMFSSFIRDYFKSELYAGIVYSQINEPDYKYLKSEFPESLLTNLTDEFKRALTMAEFELAFEKMMNYIFSDRNVFYEAFDDLTVGEEYITSNDKDETDYSDETAAKSGIFSATLQKIMAEIAVLEKEALKYPSAYFLHIAKKKYRFAVKSRAKGSKEPIK